MKRLSRVLLAVMLAGVPVLSMPIANAAPDTCTWTGATNANWDNSGNWTGCDNGNLPETGDALVFPELASNKTTVNDLGPLSFTSLQISGSGYTLTGAGVTLTATTPLTINQSATIDINITYAPSVNAFLRVASTQTLIMNGTTTFSGVTGEVNVGTGGFAGTIDFVGNIGGDAGTQFIAVNNAVAIVRGGSNTYTASTVGAESNGRFECRSTSCFGNSANDIYPGGGTVAIHQSGTYSNDLQTSAVTPNDSWLRAYVSAIITGAVTINDPLGVSQETSNENVHFIGSMTLNNGISTFGSDTTAAVWLSVTASGAGGVSVASGTTYFNGPSTYDGATTISSGAIGIVNYITGLGSTTGFTEVASGGSLRFPLSAGSTVAEPLRIAGDGLAGEGALVQADESVTLSGNIELTASSTIGVDTGAFSSAFILSGVISGTGDITLVTSPTTSVANSSIQFTGSSANTYTGAVFAQGVRFFPDKNGAVSVTGDLQVIAVAGKNASATTSFNETIANSSNVTLTKNGSNTAILNIGTGANETIGSISGDGEVSLGTNSTLNLSSNSNYTFSGDISKFTNFPAGPATIVKQGNGTATFTGGVNTSYVGGEVPVMQVNGGTMQANSPSLNLIPFSVASGSVLKGSGTVGHATILTGGSINTGNSPGCMTLSALTLTSGSVFTEEIAGTTACTTYDRATVTGTAALNNATLNVLPTVTPADGSEFTIISAASVTGTFNGLPEGSTIIANGITFRINYTATSVKLTKLSGSVATPNTGFQQSNSVLVYLSIFGALGLLLVATRLYTKTKQTK